MVRIVAVLGILAAILAGCCGRQQDIDIDNDTVAINDILNDYVVSIETGDTNMYADLVTHDTGMINFGAFGEPIHGWNELQQVIADQNATLDSIVIIVSDQRVHIASCGDIAWATSLWDFRAAAGGERVELPVRCTWVLQKSNDRWRIHHFHKSVAVQ